MLFCKKNCLMAKKVTLWREIRFNSLQDEEFCYYGRKKRRGYIAPYDKESV